MTATDQTAVDLQEYSPSDRSYSAPTSHDLANMPTTEEQPVLKYRQINKAREPHDHKDCINGKHSIFVEEAAAAFAMVCNRECRVEEKVGKGKKGYYADGESEED